MAKKTIVTIPAVGADSGDGTPLATAFQWINENFTELYDADASDVDSVNGQTGTVVLDTDDISEGATNLYNYNHTGEVTGATALTITNGAVTNAKMATNSVDSDQYVDGSIDTAHLADDIVTYDKLGVEFTSTEDLGSVSASATLDFATDQVFTATMTAATSFSFSNANIGMTKDLILTGDFTPSFPVGTKQIAGTYDGTVSNFIQIVAVANGDYWLSVSQAQ